MPTSIQIRDLSAVYGRGQRAKRAVDGVGLDIEAGELFFLLGPSGCGKTTLLRMIAGFIEPSTGTIRFGDRDVTRVQARHRDVGMVFQSYAIWPHMTVEENVAFGLRVRKVASGERRARVREALETVQLADLAQRRPNQLSGGQQQRVALARALVVRPSVLLLDEPLSNLDAKLRNELRGEIRDICKRSGTTGVYVTHDQKEALSMADRIAVMDQGRVSQVGRPLDMYRRPGSKFVAAFLGQASFLPARVEGSAGQGVLVRTEAGALVASASAAGGAGSLGPGSAVVVSIRPEAVRMEPAGGLERCGNGAGPDGRGLDGFGLRGRVERTTYLGELAQHRVALHQGGHVEVCVVNPREHAAAGGDVLLRVDPDDVVVLPAQ